MSRPGRTPLILLALWVGLLFAAAPADLPLSQALVGHTHGLAEAVRRFGELPGWMAVLGALWVLARGDRFAPESRRTARATVLLALLHPLLITQSLKLLWGRVRFRDLQDAAVFTPFYLPAGPGTGVSFPSGHAAMASVVLPLAVALWRRGRRGWAGALTAYVIVVAYGRIAIGAHYLTDVLFSVGLGVVLSAWMAGAGRGSD